MKPGQSCRKLRSSIRQTLADYRRWRPVCPFTHYLAATCIVTLMQVSPALWAADTFVKVTLQGGVRQAGRVVEWSDASLTLLQDDAMRVAAAEIAALDFPAHPVRYSSGTYVLLVNGDRLATTSPRVAAEQLTANWAQAPLRPALGMPLEFVSGALLGMLPSRPVLFEAQAELSRSPRGHDTARLLTGDDVRGELLGWEGGLIEMETSLGLTKLDQRRLRWIALDPDLAAQPELPADRWVVWLTDGSRCTSQRISPRDDGTIQVIPLTGDPFFVAWHEINRLARISPSWRPLSSRVPVDVSYTPYLTGNIEWQTDRNVLRRPLSLRGVEYATGIGMTSRMRLSYPVESGDETFHALVGLDDAAPDSAGAIFAVEVDGREVWRSESLDRQSAAVELPAIDLRGHQTLTLMVDYGRAGDRGDIANWCDAMIRRTPGNPAAAQPAATRSR